MKSRKERIADITEKLGVALAVAAFLQQDRSPGVILIYFVMAGGLLFLSVSLSARD